MSDAHFFTRHYKWYERRWLLTWAYWRQVGPMYRLTMWWLNRKRSA